MPASSINKSEFSAQKYQTSIMLMYCTDILLHTSCLQRQQSPTDARVTRIIPRWPSAAVLDIIEPEIAQFDPPTPKTLA